MSRLSGRLGQKGRAEEGTVVFRDLYTPCPEPTVATHVWDG